MWKFSFLVFEFSEEAKHQCWWWKRFVKRVELAKACNFSPFSNLQIGPHCCPKCQQSSYWTRFLPQIPAILKLDPIFTPNPSNLQIGPHFCPKSQQSSYWTQFLPQIPAIFKLDLIFAQNPHFLNISRGCKEICTRCKKVWEFNFLWNKTQTQWKLVFAFSRPTE